MGAFSVSVNNHRRILEPGITNRRMEMYTFTLPSGAEVELKEMNGEDELALTNPKLMKSGDGTNQVLQSCIVRLGDKTEITKPDVLDLLAGDRQFIMVMLRQITYGNEAELSITCQNKECGEKNSVVINIDEMEVTPYPPEREFKYDLPRSKKTVVFGLLDGHHERRLLSLQKTTLHTTMLMRIKSIGGEPITGNSLNKLPLKDLSDLRAEFKRVDGGIDTTINTRCTECGAVINTRAEAEADFFFPGLQ